MMRVFSNKIQKDDLKPGDHIYSWRHVCIYAHHGIYVGNGNVIHFTGKTVLGSLFTQTSSKAHSCPTCGDHVSNNSGGSVASSCLECFLSGGELYLFQYGVSLARFIMNARGGTCTLAAADPPEEVLHRAECLLLQTSGGHGNFRGNSEDFAIYCKTGLVVQNSGGVSLSGQRSSFFAATFAYTVAPRARGFLSSFVTYSIARILLDGGCPLLGTKKIPVESILTHLRHNIKWVKPINY